MMAQSKNRLLMVMGSVTPQLILLILWLPSPVALSTMRRMPSTSKFMTLRRSAVSTKMELARDCDTTMIPNDSNNPSFVMSRRHIFRTASLSAFIPVGASAEPILTSSPSGPSNKLEAGLLDGRVTENLMSPPPYGLEIPDILYPAYFSGVWAVKSITTDIQAPCGPMLFGGNNTYIAAKREIGPENALTYKARFVPNGSGSIIADREFNVREIAKAAMGTNAVVDVSLATPNKFSCLLSPAGASSLLSVDIIALARRSELLDEKNFDCSEVVRQIVSPANQGKPQTTLSPQAGAGRPQLLKEIETISLYTVDEPKAPGGEINEIKCIQRSATFLLPSQSDPIAYQMWQMSRGRPIDVRFYDVTYSKGLAQK